MIYPFQKNFVAVRIIFISAAIYQKHKRYYECLDIREARAIIRIVNTLNTPPPDESGENGINEEVIELENSDLIYTKIFTEKLDKPV